MRGLKALFNQIMQRLRRPPDMAKRLQSSALQEALKEARFLRRQHEVDVRQLADGEEPGPPRQAD